MKTIILFNYIRRHAMSAREEVSRICQGCGRTFTIPWAELDRKWDRGLSLPVFCSNNCALHGWDQEAMWMGNLRRSRAAEGKK